MDPLNSNPLAEEWRKEDEQEIKEAQDFLDWLHHRKEARILDKDKTVYYQILEFITAWEEFLLKLQDRYFETYQ